LAGAVVPRVVPVALFRAGDPLHRTLRRYKDAPSVAARRHHVATLTGILDRFLVAHEACLRGNGSGWDTVAVVPSTRGRSCEAGSRRPGLRVRNPLDAVVDACRTFAGVSRLRLVLGAATVGHLRPSYDAFVVDGDCGGRRVLVLDDTWTTGAHARSAAAAVSRAGATVAGILVIGRAVDPRAAVGVGEWWDRTVARQARDIATEPGPDPAAAWGSLGAGRCCLEPECR
jgi:hypothetical protein